MSLKIICLSMFSMKNRTWCLKYVSTQNNRQLISLFFDVIFIYESIQILGLLVLEKFLVIDLDIKYQICDTLSQNQLFLQFENVVQCLHNIIWQTATINLCSFEMQNNPLISISIFVFHSVEIWRFFYHSDFT